MAEQVKSLGVPPAGSSLSKNSSIPVGKNRERRRYDHEMDEREKWMLQVVLKTKGALTAIAIAIQEGKQTHADLAKSCLQLQAMAAEVLFS